MQNCFTRPSPPGLFLSSKQQQFAKDSAREQRSSSATSKGTNHPVSLNRNAARTQVRQQRRSYPSHLRLFSKASPRNVAELLTLLPVLTATTAHLPSPGDRAFGWKGRGISSLPPCPSLKPQPEQRMVPKPPATHCLQGEKTGVRLSFAQMIPLLVKYCPQTTLHRDRGNWTSAPVPHAWDFGRGELNFSLNSIPQPSRC